MMEFIEYYRLTGVITGLITFLIIGIFHPLVVKGEYYFGTGCWWVFLLVGVVGLVVSVCCYDNIILSVSGGVFGFSAFWGIGELFKQKERVEKGWFPRRGG
jgi:hypothetical protein